MSEIRALIEKLVAAGVDPVDAAEVVSRAAIHGAATAPKQKTSAAVRQERYRRNKASQVTVGDVSVDLSSPEGSSPTPPSPKPLQSIPPSPPKGGSSPTDFERFWDLFPNKVGRPSAERRFAKAIRSVSASVIIAGAERYAAKTDDRPWCNPANWISDERWNDQPAKPPDKRLPSPSGLSHLTKPQSREEYLAAEKARSERSFR